jgi:hypothetical protein
LDFIDTASDDFGSSSLSFNGEEGENWDKTWDKVETIQLTSMHQRQVSNVLSSAA